MYLFSKTRNSTIDGRRAKRRGERREINVSLLNECPVKTRDEGEGHLFDDDDEDDVFLCPTRSGPLSYVFVT